MIQQLSEPISVIFSYNHKRARSSPKSIKWKGRVYPVLKIGLHHTYRNGAVLYHTFSFSSNGLFFRIDLDTETLRWTLKEISDGLPD